jgi:hypothetical protein
MKQVETLDRWEESLEIKLKELKECQSQKSISSCMSCRDILECKLRQEYVKAVYESMNKGQGGGFEF